MKLKIRDKINNFNPFKIFFLRNSSNEFMEVGLKTLLYASLVVITSSLALAQNTDAPVIRLKEAIKLAKENSEDLALAVNTVAKNESAYREVLGTALPQVAFETTWQKYFKNAVYPTVNYQLTSGISISQTLFWRS